MLDGQGGNPWQTQTPILSSENDNKSAAEAIVKEYPTDFSKEISSKFLFFVNEFKINPQSVNLL